jgi:ATPase subunit of ABC transporter with duplicated ATPase domains
MPTFMRQLLLGRGEIVLGRGEIATPPAGERIESAARGGTAAPDHLSPMIEVQELTKTYRHFTAVKRLSFRADPGQITGFPGPNGAGKTPIRT